MVYTDNFLQAYTSVVHRLIFVQLSEQNPIPHILKEIVLLRKKMLSFSSSSEVNELPWSTVCTRDLFSERYFPGYTLQSFPEISDS